MARLELGGRGHERVGGASAQAPLQAQRHVRLEQLAGRDPLDAGGDGGGVAGERAGRGNEAGQVERAPRRAEAAAQLVEARQRALVERLEPPGAVRVLAQHVVVEAEARDGERDRPRRRRRKALDRGGEPVAQVAEPAAADALAVARPLVLAEHVEHRGALDDAQRL